MPGLPPLNIAFNVSRSAGARHSAVIRRLRFEALVDVRQDLLGFRVQSNVYVIWGEG